MKNIGMTPYEFVQKVYYMQEKVILDFWPTDDKYKEVLMEANLVLEELQKEEDWSWLRERVILGPCADFAHDHSIPEFELPPTYYKPATSFKDAVRLRPILPNCHNCHGHCHDCAQAHTVVSGPAIIQAKYRSIGSINHPNQSALGDWGQVQVMSDSLDATWTAQNIITFNRPLNPYERHCIAETDMIRRFKPFHICGPECPNWRVEDVQDEAEARKLAFSCPKIEHRILEELPDPSYVVIRTAALHAEGSPPQAGRILGLQDQAMKLLSAMRQNEGIQTTPDIIQRETLDFFQVL